MIWILEESTRTKAWNSSHWVLTFHLHCPDHKGVCSFVAQNSFRSSRTISTYAHAVIHHWPSIKGSGQTKDCVWLPAVERWLGWKRKSSWGQNEAPASTSIPQYAPEFSGTFCRYNQIGYQALNHLLCVPTGSRAQMYDRRRPNMLWLGTKPYHHTQDAESQEARYPSRFATLEATSRFRLL